MVHRALVLILFAALPAGACHGPSLRLDNPEDHALFVDGVAVPRPRGTSATTMPLRYTLPFRYFGTTRWDAVPAPSGRQPDWEHRPTSEHVSLAPPLTGWLFPLDFPVDMVAWLLHGSGDATATIAVEPTPPATIAQVDSARANADTLLARALKARIAR